MPLFSRSTFRTPRKPPRRKAESMPNISHLDESTYSTDTMRLNPAQGGAVTMSLGGHELTFEDGQWVVGSSVTEDSGPRKHTRLQRENVRLQEENNLLKYKVELLLDMLAASNADCLVLQRELEAVKKAHTQTPRRR